MLLKPVKLGRAPSLSDRDAKPPKNLPDRYTLGDLTDLTLEKLTALQNVFYADARYALLVVLQGRDASGKDGVIKTVFGACNPQGCQVTSFKVPTERERAHDFLWRVHAVTPPKSMIGIFNRSHYEDVLAARVRQIVPRAVWSKRYDQINTFEKTLSENGIVILKFFLHISRDEQRKQLVERLEDPTKNWKFRAGDLEDRKLWPEYTRAYRDALSKTSTAWAPWYVVPGDNKRTRNFLVSRVIVDRLSTLKLRYPPASPEVLALKETIV